MYQLSHLTLLTTILLIIILGALIFAQCCIDYRDFVSNYDVTIMKPKTYLQRVTQWLEFTWIRLIFITLSAICAYGQILLLIDLIR